MMNWSSKQRCDLLEGRDMREEHQIHGFKREDSTHGHSCWTIPGSRSENVETVSPPVHSAAGSSDAAGDSSPVHKTPQGGPQVIWFTVGKAQFDIPTKGYGVYEFLNICRKFVFSPIILKIQSFSENF